MRPHLPLPRNVRARLLTIVLLVLAVALAASTVAFNLLFTRTTARNETGLLHARANSELGRLGFRHGQLVVNEKTDGSLGDIRVWVFTPSGIVERPRRRTRLDAGAASLAAGPSRLLTVPGTGVRLYSLPIVIAGTRRGTLVTGLSLAPYQQTERTALRGSLALAIVMLLLAGGAAWWLLRSTLGPVARMTEQAAAWSEEDLDRRFGLGSPRDELTQLAATLDGLLDRIAASLRHERRFSAELSHELRTPLARLISETELTLRREREPSEYRQALERGLVNAKHVARIVETLVAAARQDAEPTRGTADAYAVALDVVEEVEGLAQERQIALVAEEPASALRLGLDGDLAARVLQPVVENACRYGSSEARVTIRRDGSRVTYVVDDDGPGVAADERETIFDPGVRGSAGRDGSATPGAGLGLALARRLARATSGDVTVEPTGNGGCFLISLPAA
jgi:two-component system, OmpR family, sensor kinase